MALRPKQAQGTIRLITRPREEASSRVSLCTGLRMLHQDASTQLMLRTRGHPPIRAWRCTRLNKHEAPLIPLHTHPLARPAMNSQGYQGAHAVSLKGTTPLPSRCRSTHETHQALASHVQSTRIEETRSQLWTLVLIPGLIPVASTLQDTDLVLQWLAGVTQGQRFGVIPGQSCRAPGVTREQKYPVREEIQEIRESWPETQ